MIAQNRGGSERRTPNVGGMAPSRISIGAWPLQQVLDQGWFSPVGARCAGRSGASHGVVPLKKVRTGPSTYRDCERQKRREWCPGEDLNLHCISTTST